MRNEILRQPLGLDLYQENTDWEQTARHFGAYQEGQLVACLIACTESSNRYRIRQMATQTDCQGMGIGRELMLQVEKKLLESGATGLALNARVSAKGFYEKLGYRVAGDEFVEVTVPHVRMEKELK